MSQDKHKQDMDAVAWLLLFGGAFVILISVLLIVGLSPVCARPTECNEHDLTACNTTLWRLELNGIPIEGAEGLTQEQCGWVREDLEPQTPSFTSLLCVEYHAARTDA